MKLNLGTKIKEFRKKTNCTQEQFATALGVTSQAVSRWESGGSYPDMEIVPSIANFFGISLDELFGYDNVREKRIEKIVNQLTQMNAQNNGVDVNIDECIFLARNALAEFPANERIMLCLADILTNAGYVKYGEHHLTDNEGYDFFDIEKHRTYMEWSEAISIYEKLISVLPDNSIRHNVIKQLSHLYANTGEYKKANDLSETVPDIYCCREFLKFNTCDGKEKAAKYAETAMLLLGIVSELIGDAVATNYDKIKIEEAEKYIKNAANIFDILCLDGEYGQYRIYSARLYLYLSTLQWRSGSKDDAFISLDKAFEHTTRCERFSTDTNATFISPLLKNVKLNPDGKDFKNYSAELPSLWPWICIPDCSDVAVEIQSDVRWNEWVTKTKKCSLRVELSANAD